MSARVGEGREEIAPNEQAKIRSRVENNAPPAPFGMLVRPTYEHDWGASVDAGVDGATGESTLVAVGLADVLVAFLPAVTVTVDDVMCSRLTRSCWCARRRWRAR